MDLQEIKSYIDQNKDNEEVKTYLQGLNPLNVEGVEKYLTENEDAKKWLDSVKDKHFNKAFETFKKNNWEKEVEAEIKKRFPDKDPKDVELVKLQQEVEKMKQEKLHETLKNKALTYATEKKLPVNLVDYFLGQDEEGTIKNLNALEEVFNVHIQSQVEERLKTNNYTPPKGGDKGKITLDMVNKMSPKEINENWDTIKELLKS